MNDRNTDTTAGIGLVARWRRAWRIVVRDTFGAPKRSRVRVRDHRGACWTWNNENDPPARARDRRPDAVLLDPDDVLERRLELPIELEHIDEALRWNALAASPFGVDETLYAVREDPQTSPARRNFALFLVHVDTLAAAQATASEPADRVQWWAAPYAPLPGPATDRRARAAHARRRRIVVLTGLMVALIVVAALLPVWFQRETAHAVDVAASELRASSGVVAARRDALRQTYGLLEQAQRFLDARPDPRLALARLTELLDDDAYLQRFEQIGNEVRMIGETTSDATVILDRLRAEPWFSDVRTPSPIARGPTGGERFTIHLRVRPEQASSPQVIPEGLRDE